MDIPEPFNSIIKTSYAQNNKNIKKFFDDCFEEIIKKLNITNYQARAAKTGEMFEYAFWYLIKQNGIELDANVELKKACMAGKGKLDFGIMNDRSPLCGIEAKGSSEAVSERPALKRTDTAKKAIAQAFQFKKIYPDVPFYVVTNVRPTSGNAKCMLDLAEGDIIDRVVDVTNNTELASFVTALKKIAKP